MHGEHMYEAGKLVQVTVASLALVGAAKADATTECMTKAFTEYNANNIAIYASTDLPLPPEKVVAQRRLEEQYCARVAICLASKYQNNRLLVSTYFSDCLQDEAEEKYKIRKSVKGR